MSCADRLRGAAEELDGLDAALLREAAGELDSLERDKARYKRLSWTWRRLAAVWEDRVREVLGHEPCCVSELRNSIDGE
jgi:hypothetical protein